MVLICWHLDRKMFRDGLRGNSYPCRMWSRGRGTQHKREIWFTPVVGVTRLSSLCKHLTSTQFGSTVAMCLSARVGARRTTLSTDTTILCVASLTIGRYFETSPCGRVGQRGRRGRGLFLPPPGRGQTSSTISFGSQVFFCLFLSCMLGV